MFRSPFSMFLRCSLHFYQYTCNNIILIALSEAMMPKPNYLDLQNQLYYPITLHKELIFDNHEDHFHLELFQSVAYDSYDRRIQLTDPIIHVLRKAYGIDQEYQVYVFDPCVQTFRFLAYFPQEDSITLGEQFLQADTLLFEIRKVPEREHPDTDELEMSHMDELDLQEEEEEVGVAGGPQQKVKRRRTIRDMLEIIQKWRKLFVQSGSKLTVIQGSELIGISKRTLEFYLHSVKLGERYGYPFESSLDLKISDLKKFLRIKSEEKKTQEMEMFWKFKSLYK